MSVKIFTTAIATAVLLAFTLPTFAADAPTTKAACKKMADMKWDATTKTCVKK
jgi:hypothetical protein